MATGQTTEPVKPQHAADPGDWQTVNPADQHAAKSEDQHAATPAGQHADDPGDWQDAHDTPFDASGNSLPLLGHSKAGFPVYQGTPAHSHPITPANERDNPAAFDPNTMRGMGARWGEALKGGASGIQGLFSLDNFPGSEGNPIIWNPLTQFKKDWQGVKDWNELRKMNPDFAWGAMLAPMLVTHTLSALLEPAGMTAKLTRGAGVNPAYIEPVVADLRKFEKGVAPKSVKNPWGKPVTVGDSIKVAGKAEKALNDEYRAALGNHAIVQDNLPNVNGQFPLAEAIRKLKERMPATTAADRAERAFIDQSAAEFEKPISLGELDLKRMQANARLDPYYNKNMVEQYASKYKNSSIAIDKAVADWVRDNAYPKMDRLSNKPTGYFRDIKSRISNLMNFQSQATDFAEKAHWQSMEKKGTTRWQRVKPGGSVSMHGTPHGFVSNIPDFFRAPNPEGAANAAVRSGFSTYQRVMPRLTNAAPLSMPLASLMSYLRMHPSNNPGGQQAAPVPAAPAPQQPVPQAAPPAAPPAAKPSELKAEAATRAAPQTQKKNYAHWAQGEDGKYYGSDDGKTWFNYETGQKVE